MTTQPQPPQDSSAHERELRAAEQTCRDLESHAGDLGEFGSRLRAALAEESLPAPSESLHAALAAKLAGQAVPVSAPVTQPVRPHRSRRRKIVFWLGASAVTLLILFSFWLPSLEERRVAQYHSTEVEKTKGLKFTNSGTGGSYSKSHFESVGGGGSASSPLEVTQSEREKTPAASGGDFRVQPKIDQAQIQAERLDQSMREYAAQVKAMRLLEAERKGRASPETSLQGKGMWEHNAFFKPTDPAQYNQREGYAQNAENIFLRSTDHPLSTFSIDVDTASYANMRRFITSGQVPPPQAVRVEEFINYFKYDYAQPKAEQPFSVALEAAECPWNREHRLVRIGLQGKEIPRTRRPPSNLVFLVDVSGSMASEDKLPLLKSSLKQLVHELGEDDFVSIVTYAGDAGVRLASTNATEKDRINGAIDSLNSGGGTHGSAGIMLAYEQARAGFREQGTNRVILCTDGDLNIGVTSDDELERLIRKEAESRVFLTVLGFGTGNLQDAKMERIADRGNGIYAYIDSLREARKVLVEQMSGSLVTIAKDVKIQVEFNPRQVASYRLIGYENRALAAKDFNDDRKDAGEIGAGHSVTALYEIALVGASETPGVDPLKYQPSEKPVVDPAVGVQRELLTVKLRYKEPNENESKLLERSLADHGGRFAEATPDFRFASAVAGFGMSLRRSEFKGDLTLAQIEEMAGGALGNDPTGSRAEFVDLVRKSRTLLQ